MSSTMTSTNASTTKEQAADLEFSNKGQGNQPSWAIYSPNFDLWEGADEYVLFGDLPGVAQSDLHIEYENRQLTIYGKVSRCRTNTTSLFTEYGVGDFQRVFTVGETIDSEGITAELHDGVLTLHLPKSSEAKPRRIAVKSD